MPELHDILNIVADTGTDGSQPPMPSINTIIGPDVNWVAHGRYHFAKDTKPFVGFEWHYDGKNMNRWWAMRKPGYQLIPVGYSTVQVPNDWDYAGYTMVTGLWGDPDPDDGAEAEDVQTPFLQALDRLSKVIPDSLAGLESGKTGNFHWTPTGELIKNLLSLEAMFEEYGEGKDSNGYLLTAYKNLDIPEGPMTGAAASVFGAKIYDLFLRFQDMEAQIRNNHEAIKDLKASISTPANELREAVAFAVKQESYTMRGVLDYWYHEYSNGHQFWPTGSDQFWIRISEGVAGVVSNPVTDTNVNNALKAIWKDNYSTVIEKAETLYKTLNEIYENAHKSLHVIEEPQGGIPLSMIPDLEDEDILGGGDEDGDGIPDFPDEIKIDGDLWGDGPPDLDFDDDLGDGPPDLDFDGDGPPDLTFDDDEGTGGSGDGPPDLDFGSGDGPPDLSIGDDIPLPDPYLGLNGPGTGDDWSDSSGGGGLPGDQPPVYMAGDPNLPLNGPNGTGGGPDFTSDPGDPLGQNGPLPVPPPFLGLNGPGSTGNGNRPPSLSGPGTDFPPPTELELDPETGLPIDPETGRPYPVDPDTGLPYNPDNGLPLNYDPETGLVTPIDPVTGLPVENGGTRLDMDPETGLPINPETGRPYPVDPDTGLPYNPDNGLPLNYDPVTGQVTPIDPVTGLPVTPDLPTIPEPDPGLGTDFPDDDVYENPFTGEPAEIDPETGLPYPIDPETGEAIKEPRPDPTDFPRFESEGGPEPLDLNYGGVNTPPSAFSSGGGGGGGSDSSDRTQMFAAPTGAGGGGLQADGGGGAGAPGAGGAGGAAGQQGMGGAGSPMMPPMMPPMGGMGGGGGGGENRDRNRTTWLSEDEKVWGTDKNQQRAVLGRPVPGQPKKGAQRHEFVDAGADGGRTGTASHDDEGTLGRKRKPGVGNRRGRGQEQAGGRDGGRDGSAD